MGIPLQRACAAPGCTAVGAGGDSWVSFSAAECFTKVVPNAPQLWACCPQHKRESLLAILQDLPYRHSKREHAAPAVRR